MFEQFEYKIITTNTIESPYSVIFYKVYKDEDLDVLEYHFIKESKRKDFHTIKRDKIKLKYPCWVLPYFQHLSNYSNANIPTFGIIGTISNTDNRKICFKTKEKLIDELNSKLD